MKGFTCFSNLGNTCFINSALVILAHINILNEVDSKDLELLNDWKEIYNIYWNNNCVITPHKFIKINIDLFKLKNKNDFLINSQCDSVEYLLFILEIIDEYYKSYENNKISDLFTLEYNYKYLSENKENVLFEKKEKQWVLNLNIPNEDNPTIEDCLKYTFDDEFLNNSWLDERDNIKKNIYIKTRLINNPEILIIQLKRININSKFRKVVKLKEYLDMSIISQKHDNYELFGIINHVGTIKGGHYFTTIKKYNRWFIFNDNNIQETSFKSLANSYNYCLFYKRI